MTLTSFCNDNRYCNFIGAAVAQGRRRGRSLLNLGEHLLSQAPYTLEALHLAAPFDLHRGEVLKDWVDWNGHMNVGYYVVAFDRATGVLFNNLGMPYEYTKLKIGMYFVVECHVNYGSELLEGEAFFVESQIVDFDHKRLHLFHTMRRVEDQRLVATNELMLMNIDYESRRSAPWPIWAKERIAAMAAAHQALAKPDRIGSVIGIRRAGGPT